MYAIMGASGHVGNLIAKNLIQKGEKVRCIGRSEERMKDLIDLGCEPWIGDAHDAVFLTDCFKDCDAIFCMIPPDYGSKNVRQDYNDFGQAICEAIEKSGCRKVVNLSSVGAEEDWATGPVKGLYDQEQRLDKLNKVDVIHLRASYFLENFINTIETINSEGVVATPIREDAQIYSVASQDIADRATNYLLGHEFEGHTHKYLLGAKETNFQDITKQFGSAIGKPDLRYVQWGYDEAKLSMMEQGLSEDVANNMIELYKAANDGILNKYANEEKNEECFTQTTPEQFAQKYLKPLVK